MRDFMAESVFLGSALTLAAYQLGLWVKRKTGWEWLNPLLTAVILIILLLTAGGIELETYDHGARYVGFLLTPATVCLALPLYQQLQLLKRHVVAIGLGIFSGVLTGMTTVCLLSLLFHLDHAQYVTLLPKSVTAAIGIVLSEQFGGIPAITVAVTVITGIFGHVVAETVLRLFSVTNAVAKGVGIGCAAHAIGTTKALEMGEVEGAMSSLSIVVSGLITVALSMVYQNLI